MTSRADSLLNIIKRHLGAVVIAVIIGSVTVAPQLFAIYTVPGYAGITLTGTDSEEHYVARVQEVYDGYPSAGNIFFSDKNVTPLQPNLGEAVVAYIGMALHLSAPQIVVVGKFVFPFIVVLEVYALVYLLTRRKTAAGLAVLFVMCGDALMSKPRALVDLLQGKAPIVDFLTYARPINPEVTGVLLFFALLLIARLFIDEQPPLSSRVRIWLLLCLGVVTSLVLYISFFAYVFLMALGTCFFVYAVISQRYTQLYELLGVGVIAVLGAIPFAANVLHAMANPAYTEASMRFGLIATHAPVLGLWIPLIVAGTMVFGGYKKASAFFLCGAAALVIVLNQQLVTGHALQSGHFHWYITKPFVGMLLGLMVVVAVEWLTAERRLQQGLYGLVAGVLLYNAVLAQVTAYLVWAPYVAEIQAYAPVLAYIRQYETGESVWADQTLSLHIPMYTHADAPNNKQAICYLLPNELLLNVMFLEYKLQGVSPRTIREVLYRDRGLVSGQIYGVYWPHAAGTYDAIPDATLDAFADAYEAYYSMPYVNSLKQLRVTRVVWDTAKEPRWRLDSVPGLHEDVRIGRFVIYRI